MEAIRRVLSRAHSIHPSWLNNLVLYLPSLYVCTASGGQPRPSTTSLLLSASQAYGLSSSHSTHFLDISSPLAVSSASTYSTLLSLILYLTILPFSFLFIGKVLNGCLPLLYPISVWLSEYPPIRLLTSVARNHQQLSHNPCWMFTSLSWCICTIRHYSVSCSVAGLDSGDHTHLFATGSSSLSVAFYRILKFSSTSVFSLLETLTLS